MQVSWRKPLYGANTMRGGGMPLSIVLPVSLAAMALVAICLTMADTRDQRAHLCIAAGTGLIAWTLLEYGIHRFILHGMWPFKAWHAAHHAGAGLTEAEASLLIAAPLLILAWVGAAMLGPARLGAAACLGLFGGCGTCMALHHAIHHLPCGGPTWLMQRKFHHALHHESHGQTGYYGVTTCLWDRLLGTHRPQEF